MAVLTWKLPLFTAAAGSWTLGAWLALRPLVTAAARQAARELLAYRRPRRTDHN